MVLLYVVMFDVGLWSKPAEGEFSILLKANEQIFECNLHFGMKR